MRVLPISTNVTVSVEGPPQGQWTYDDWYTLDTDHNKWRYEVIDGTLYVTDVPFVFHQHVIQQFFRYFGIPLENHRKEGRYVLFYTGLVMPNAIT